ncbi:hypothetical protein [Thalassospira povalilytica]|uniref:hypothetical protein n=1 Tax=Thalassospira povalilytica TaxID=732237 RepID=UPI003AA7BA83
MTKKLYCSIFDGLVSILCVFALVMVGFAHVFPQARAQANVAQIATSLDITQFALPDGVVPYICSAPENSDPVKSPQNSGWGQDCPACQIVAAFLMPRPGLGLKVRKPYAQIVVAPAKASVCRAEPVFHETSPRAPPVLIE